MQTALLHVASDTSVTVVSRHRLRMVGGRVTRRHWDAVLETTSTTPVTAAPASLAGAATIVLPPAAVAVPLALAGLPWSVSTGAGLLVFFAAAYLQPVLRRRRRRMEAAPALARAVLLVEARERAAFAGALDRADDISATWPAMAGLVDVAQAENLLADALWNLAGVLARRQEARRITASLTESLLPGLETAADAELETQRRRAADLLAALDAEVARRLTSLSSAAEAGQRYAREREIRRAVGDAARALDNLTTPAILQGAAAPDGARELSERTSAVLAAYRELADRHGDGTTDLV